MSSYKAEEEKIELKPCPFCGSGDVEIFNGDMTGFMEYRAVIYCHKCKSAHFDVYAQGFTEDDVRTARKKVARLWNRRQRA